MDALRFEHATVRPQSILSTITRAWGLLLIGLLLGVFLPLRAGAQESPGVETLTAASVETNGRFGMAVAGGRDVNGDGTPDLLAGVFGESIDDKTRAGRVYLFSGTNGEVLRPLSSPNVQKNSWFGRAVAGGGDHTGDGTPDLLIGALGEGCAYLLDETDGTTLRTLTSPNDKKDGLFGAGVGGGTDVNGDGTPDLLVGAPFESLKGTSKAGRVYLFDLEGTP